MNKTICFLGDSITANGSWETEIFEKARFDGLRFYNCGVPGDTAAFATDRIYSTCMNYNPDLVSVMFGVNDNNCGYYYNKQRVDGQLEKERLEAKEHFEKFCDSIKIISDTVQKSGSTLILCTPVPFDNVTCGEMEKDLSAPLDKATDFIFSFAKERNIPVVDFNGEMKKYMSTEKIFNDDRVHPNQRGYRLMAQIWSKTVFNGKYATNANSELSICKTLSERAKIENCLTELRLVEYCFFHDLRMKNTASLAERINEAKARLEKAQAENQESQKSWYSHYLNNINNIEKLESEYVKLTVQATYAE